MSSLFFSKRNFASLGLFLFFLILFLPLTSAIGVTPPYAKVNYYDGFDETYSFTLINNAVDADQSVEFSTSGSLANYATLSEDSFSFVGKTKRFDVNLKLPPYEDLGVYGKQMLRVRATERVKDAGMFSVGTAVEVWVQVYIPVPGAFAEVESVSVGNVFEGEDSSFSFTIANRGTQDLSDTSAVVTVTDYLGNKMDSFVFKNLDVPFEDTLTISDSLPSSKYSSGKYFLSVDYTFDQEFVPSSRTATFFVGSSDIIVTNYTSNLVAGEINKVTITTQSLWGSQLSNVLFSLNYAGVAHNLPPITYEPFKEMTFDAFIEAPLIEDKKIDSIPFSASLDIVIPVDDSSIQKSVGLDFVVVNNSKSFSLADNLALIIVIIVLIVILINVLFFFKFKKKSKKK